MSTKFKVGDRVRFKEQYHNWVTGEEAVVVKIGTDAEEYTLATVSNGHRKIGVYVQRLELVPPPKLKGFKVGDEVEFLQDYDNQRKGDRFVVREVSLGGTGSEYDLIYGPSGGVGVYAKRLKLVADSKKKSLDKLTLGDSVIYGKLTARDSGRFYFRPLGSSNVNSYLRRDGWVLTEGREDVELPTGKDAIIKLTRGRSNDHEVVLEFLRRDVGTWQIIRQGGKDVATVNYWRDQDFRDEFDVTYKVAPKIEVLYAGH